MVYQVVVADPFGERFTIDLCDNEEEMQRVTVGELKDKMKNRIPGYAKENIELICGNKTLDDDTKRLVDYGIIHKSCIFIDVNTDGARKPDPRDDGMGDKEGETRRSKEQLKLNL